MNKFDQLDELSGGKLGAYITKSRSDMDDRMAKDDRSPRFFKKQSNRAAGVSRAGSKLLGGRDEYGSGVSITYNKPKVKASLTKENVESLITSAANAEPATFVEQFNDIVLSKIEERLEEFKNYLTQTIYNESANEINLEYFLENYDQLDEISKQKLLDYIGSASIDKSMASHDHAYHQGVNYGRFTAGKKGESHDIAHLDKLSKRHGRRSGGIQLAAAKLAGGGIDKHSRARVAATNKSSE